MNWQSSGNDDCCSKGIAAGFCGVGEGDCDEDSDCAGSLVCGSDNCPWGDGDDCCMHPGMHVYVTTCLVPKICFHVPIGLNCCCEVLSLCISYALNTL